MPPSSLAPSESQEHSRCSVCTHRNERVLLLLVIYKTRNSWVLSVALGASPMPAPGETGLGFISFQCKALTTGSFHLISHSARGPTRVSLCLCLPWPPAPSTLLSFPYTHACPPLQGAFMCLLGPQCCCHKEIRGGEPHVGASACELSEPWVSDLTLRDRRWV